MATAVHDGLADVDVLSALVEVDELERTHPPLDEPRVLGNVAALCATPRDAGHDLVLGDRSDRRATASRPAPVASARVGV